MVVAVTATVPGDNGQAEGDEIMGRIGVAIAASQKGQRSDARAAFAEIWAEIDDGGDPLHRCVLAHHMADVQDDPREELVWDLRALEAALSVTDGRAAAAGATLPVDGFYPSLHLNLGEDYRKLGDIAQARRHLDLGRQAAVFLGDDPYSSMIVRGLDGLAKRLSE
jgi:hypothetical protein